MARSLAWNDDGNRFIMAWMDCLVWCTALCETICINNSVVQFDMEHAHCEILWEVYISNEDKDQPQLEFGEIGLSWPRVWSLVCLLQLPRTTMICKRGVIWRFRLQYQYSRQWTSLNYSELNMTQCWICWKILDHYQRLPSITLWCLTTDSVRWLGRYRSIRCWGCWAQTGFLSWPLHESIIRDDACTMGNDDKTHTQVESVLAFYILKSMYLQTPWECPGRITQNHHLLENLSKNSAPHLGMYRWLS